jgi:hypothetical protein
MGWARRQDEGWGMDDALKEKINEWGIVKG